MAKRSDFTQKLLDDLRLRKEKMSMASSSSNQQSARAPATAKIHRNGNTQWSLQGPREATNKNLTSKNTVSPDITKIWLGTQHHKPCIDHNADVSMGLTLALSNNGKLRNIEFFTNANMGNNRIMHHGSLQFRENNHLQIGEVSKGIQHLNKILKACSNGLGFSRDSIDIGRELLKGAMDLEESLRILASLQEASEYMAGSRAKNVKLLKDKEGKESSMHEVNQKRLINRPKFSFDGPAVHSLEHDRKDDTADFKDQKELNLTYDERSKKPSKASIKFITYRKPASSGSGSKTDAHFSSVARKESKNEELKSLKNENYCTTSSKNIMQFSHKENHAGKKVRIPNVVAKLMGLEEIPLPIAEVKKNSEVQKCTKPNDIQKADVVPYSGRKFYQTNIQKVPEEKDSIEYKAVNNTETVYNKGWGEKNTLENISPVLKHSSDNMYNKKESKDNKKDIVKRDETTSVKEDTSHNKAPLVTNNVKRPYKDHDDAVSKHELSQRKKDWLLEGKRNSKEKIIVPSNQSSTSKDKVARKQSTVSTSKGKHVIHEMMTEKEHDSTNKPQLTVQKKEVKLKSTEKPPYDMSTLSQVISRSSTNTLYKEQLRESVKSRHHENQQLNKRRPTYREVERKSNPITGKEKVTRQHLEPSNGNPTNILSVHRVDVTKAKAQINGSNTKLLERPRRLEAPPAERQELTKFLQELECRWKERNDKAEGAIIIPRATNLITVHSTLTDDCSKQKLADQRIVAENFEHGITVTESTAQHHQDHVEQHLMLTENKLEDQHGIMALCNTSKRQNEAIAKVDGQGSLTKNELILKQIVMNNQDFLNTAQALFTLKIPVSVLQASEDASQNEASKLLLDCGQEIMRRKGNREEFIFTKRMSFAPAKLRCFDELIKELNDELECLMMSSKVGSNDNSTAEWLHGLLDREIQNRNPDVNCMWNSGWNTTRFANIEKDGVVRDVERHMLNGLINELVIDLLKQQHYIDNEFINGSRIFCSGTLGHKKGLGVQKKC